MSIADSVDCSSGTLLTFSSSFSSSFSFSFSSLLWQTGSYWETRYLVFNLKDSAILIYESDREIRSNIKARVPMPDLVRASVPVAKSNEFIIETAKRTYCFRAPTKEHRDAWVRIINTVSPKAGTKTAAHAARARLGSASTPRSQTTSRRSTLSTSATP